MNEKPEGGHDCLDPQNITSSIRVLRSVGMNKQQTENAGILLSHKGVRCGERECPQRGGNSRCELGVEQAVREWKAGAGRNSYSPRCRSTPSMPGRVSFLESFLENLCAPVVIIHIFWPLNRLWFRRQNLWAESLIPLCSRSTEEWDERPPILHSSQRQDQGQVWYPSVPIEGHHRRGFVVG